MNTKALWKCMVKDCGYTAPPTEKGYKQIVGHMLGHASKGVPKDERKYSLVDEEGNALAQTIIEAKQKGLLVAETDKPPEVSPQVPDDLTDEELEARGKGKEEELEAKGKGKKEEPEITSEGIFAYTIHLPADAFTLFNLAKFSGLEKDGDKPFDEFVWDCIHARFKYDYEMELVLAPIPEERKRR